MACLIDEPLYGENTVKSYTEKTIVGFGTLVTGSIMYFLSSTQIKEVDKYVGMAPQDMPLVLSKVTIGLAIIMFLEAFFTFKKAQKTGQFQEEEIHFYGFPFMIYGIMWVYALLLGGIGYFISSIICLSLVVYLLKEKAIKNYFVLCGVIAVVYIAFGIGLNIPLGRLGILF